MKKILSFLKPGFVAVLSLLIVSAFLRYYLFINANQLVREFKNQNYREIYSSDTLKISARLNSLSSVINWVCIEGSIAGKSFYLLERGKCETGLFKQKQEISILEANNLKIAFTLRLPEEVETLFLLFLILQAFLILTIIISTRNAEQEKHVIEKKIGKIARQMSHDIRSPLATLNNLLSISKSLDQSERILLEKSITRINDISNNLLKETKKDDSYSDIPKIIDTNLNSLINDIINEKKISHPGLRIDLIMHEGKLISEVDEVEFKRLFSNLLNNSIESSTNLDTLLIQISTKKINDKALVIIQDNGCGIPSDILSRIGKKEVTTKKQGNGIGLVHAFESVHDWNGEIEINSQVEKGTTIKISLPSKLKSKNQYVLIDNDDLVQLTWSSAAKKMNTELTIFKSKGELFKNIKNITLDSFIYIDSELDNGEKGEDIAKQLHSMGYLNIYMTSGHDKSHFAHLKFIKGVINKNPPWN